MGRQVVRKLRREAAKGAKRKVAGASHRRVSSRNAAIFSFLCGLRRLAAKSLLCRSRTHNWRIRNTCGSTLPSINSAFFPSARHLNRGRDRSRKRSTKDITCHPQKVHSMFQMDCRDEGSGNLPWLEVERVACQYPGSARDRAGGGGALLNAGRVLMDVCNRMSVQITCR